MGGREGEKERKIDGEREGGWEGGREGGREGWREGGREGWREGGRACLFLACTLQNKNPAVQLSWKFLMVGYEVDVYSFLYTVHIHVALT